jgi:hypothetical protein
MFFRDSETAGVAGGTNYARRDPRGGSQSDLHCKTNFVSIYHQRRSSVRLQRFAPTIGQALKTIASTLQHSDRGIARSHWAGR